MLKTSGKNATNNSGPRLSETGVKDLDEIENYTKRSTLNCSACTGMTGDSLYPSTQEKYTIWSINQDSIQTRNSNL